MFIFAICQGASFVALVVFFFGSPWTSGSLHYVASMGYVNAAEISINGIPLDGLQRVWERNELQTAAVWYFVIGMIFMLEFYLQFGHYVLAYTVSAWYFSGGTSIPKQYGTVLKKALGGAAIGKIVPVRVGGIDANYGQRHGTIVSGQGGKYLVVPVERKGPGLGRNDLVNEEWSMDDGPSLFAVAQGALSVLMYHAGSLAVGSVIIFFLRPFRMLQQAILGFLTRVADSEKGRAHDPDPHKANVKACLSLLSAFFDQVFAKYSKTAFTELALNGGQRGRATFMTCSSESFDFLVHAGGSIANLYNSMFLYEVFGCFAITTFSGWVCMILQDKLDMFAIEGQAYYIEDKNASLITCMIIAFAISFAWMSMWNQSADVLLYNLAWNRNQAHLGHAGDLPHNLVLKDVDMYAPQTLRNIIPDYERETRYEHGLHAHGLGQQGAILAAMEHGAMNSVGNAPDYSKAFANTQIMASKMVG